MNKHSEFYEFLKLIKQSNTNHLNNNFPAVSKPCGTYNIEADAYNIKTSTQRTAILENHLPHNSEIKDLPRIVVIKPTKKSITPALNEEIKLKHHQLDESLRCLNSNRVTDPEIRNQLASLILQTYVHFGTAQFNTYAQWFIKTISGTEVSPTLIKHLKKGPFSHPTHWISMEEGANYMYLNCKSDMELIQQYYNRKEKATDPEMEKLIQQFINLKLGTINSDGQLQLDFTKLPLNAYVSATDPLLVYLCNTHSSFIKGYKQQNLKCEVVNSISDIRGASITQFATTPQAVRGSFIKFNEKYNPVRQKQKIDYYLNNKDAYNKVAQSSVEVLEDTTDKIE